MADRNRKSRICRLRPTVPRTVGVEIVAQTMPSFPWHFGGQAFHNLFMDLDEIVQFCSANNMRICLARLCLRPTRHVGYLNDSRGPASLIDAFQKRRSNTAWYVKLSLRLRLTLLPIMARGRLI